MKKAFRRWCALLLSVAMLFTMDGTIYAAETAGAYTAQAVADGGDAQQVTVAEMAESAEVKSVAETTESIEASSAAETEESVEASSAEETEESVEASSVAETEESAEASSAAETEETVEASSALETRESVDVVSAEEVHASADAALAIGVNDEEYNGFWYDTIYGDIKITGYTGSETTLDIPAQIGGKNVVMIAEDVFADNTAITSVTIPATVTSIGSSAFEGCTRLASVVIPETVTSIGKNAFKNCTGLAEMTINGSALNSINYSHSSCSDSILYNTGSSEGFTLTFGNGVTAIPAYLCYENNVSRVVIGDAVETVGSYAFAFCHRLQKVSLGSGVTSIGESAFRYSGVKEVEGGETLMYMESDAFSYSEITEYINFPALAEIPENAYYHCESLENVEITGTVTSIGKNAFKECTALKTVTVGGAVTSIGESAFAKNTALQSVTISAPVTAIEKDTFLDDTALAEIVLPSALTSIGDSAFSGNTALAGIVLPSALTSIGDNAFSGNTALTEIVLPSAVTTIGSKVFSDDTALSKVVLSESLTTVGNSAFYNCTGLTDLTINARELVDLGERSAQVAKEEYKVAIGGFFTTKYEIRTRPIPHSDAVFYNAGSTEGFTVTFGENVTKVPAYLFATGYVESGEKNDSLYCKVSKVVFVGSNVQTINPYAFYNCQSLKEVEGVVASIGNSAFEICGKLKSVNLGSATTSIGEKAFYKCSALRNVEGGTGVNSVGNYAFAHTDLKAAIQMPNLITLGAYAYYHCVVMESVDIGDAVTSIGEHAFEGCEIIKTVTIGSAVKSIGASAFKDCTGITDMTINAKELEVNTLEEREYSDDSELLVFYNAGSVDGFTVTFGEEVTIIPAYLFYSETLPYLPGFKDCKVSKVIFGSKVQRIGEKAFYECCHLKELVGGSGVTEIGAGAFALTSLTTYGPFPLVTVIEDSVFCATPLTSLDLPEGVTSIGDSAFAGCSLTEVKLPNTLTSMGDSAFAGCSLTEVKLPDTLASMGDAVFESCGSLTEVTLPNTLTSMGNRVFYGCGGLKNVTLPSALTSMGYSVFENCSSLEEITLPNTLTSIQEKVFSGCSGLKKITVPTTLTSIGYKAFAGCSSLAEIILPDSLADIGSSAFSDCSGLKKVTLPKTLTSIDYSVFSGCSSLVDLKLPDTLESISSSAFSGCSSLTEITLPDSLIDLGSSAFLDCSGLKKATLPMALKSINSSVFFGCSSLTEVKFPDTLMYIKSSAFSGCSSLTEVKLPDTLTRIEDSAFFGCSSLEKLTLPVSLIYMGEGVFSDCTGLKEMIINARKLTVKTNNGSPFYNTGSKEEFKVTFGEQVRVIPSDMFMVHAGTEEGKHCKVSEVYVSGNVMEIGSDAFYHCSNLKDVYLTGNMPEINSWSFKDVTCNIHYPESNETYTSSSRKNYGGTLTWIPVPGEKVSVESISFEPTSLTLAEYQTSFLDVKFTPSNATNKAVTWSSSNRNVATVDEYGEVTAKGLGTATITATTDDGSKTASCVVTVTAALSGVSVDEQISLAPGGSKALTIRPNPSTAVGVTLNAKILSQTPESGSGTVIQLEKTTSGWRVNGVAVGTAVIEASATDGNHTYTARCEVTVKEGASDSGDDSGDNSGDNNGNDVENDPEENGTVSSKDGFWIAGISGTGYSYTGATIKPVVRVYYKNTLLRVGSEYSISYKKNKAVGNGQIVLTGKGAYKGKHTEEFKINACDLSVDNPLVSVFAVKSDKGLVTTVTVAGKIVKPAKNYTFKENGDGTVTVSGTGNYTGSRTVTISDTAPDSIKTAVITIPKSVEYTGSPIKLTGEELKLSAKSGAQLEQGTHYTVKYEANQNVGTATVYITGLIDSTGKGYSGTVKKTFKITPAQFDDNNTVVEAADKAGYVKGGAKPTPKIIWICARTGKSWTLRQGVDYSVSYTQNSKPGTASMTIKGIGSFKGSKLATRSFQVTAKNISECYGYCVDKEYKPIAKGSYYMSAPVIYDTNGKKLTINKDYTVSYINQFRDEAINKDDKNAYVREGDLLGAVVTGINNYTGTCVIDYYAPMGAANINNISKAKASKVPVQEYTGKEIDLKEQNAFPKVTLGNKTVYESGAGYRIVDYFNNVDKGTASVLIAGTGEYSGSKLITFKIVAKKWDNLWTSQEE